jgi:riboflavin synthase alpha subunit
MWAAVTLLAAGLCAIATAQDAPPVPPQGGAGPGRGMGRDFHVVGGQITAIEGATITLENRRGDTAKVKITPSTRLMKNGSEAKLSDFKVGDRVFAAGEQDKDGVWIAQMLGQRNGPGGMGGAQAKPEDNGKTYILGELIKIDGTKLTVRKPDNTEQVIEVDDDTSFRNERRESVTLADMKVGDFVRGQGAVQSGVFVPKVLFAGRPRGPRATAPPGAAPQAQKPPVPDSNDQMK